MLNEAQIEKKLFDQAGYFDHHFRRKEYLEASLCADWAEMTAMFIGLEESKKVELFGTRQTDPPVEGLIREEKRMKADEWCIFRGGYAYSRHTYQNVMKLL